jgi:hypothetical protein
MEPGASVSCGTPRVRCLSDCLRPGANARTVRPRQVQDERIRAALECPDGERLGVVDREVVRGNNLPAQAHDGAVRLIFGHSRCISCRSPVRGFAGGLCSELKHADGRALVRGVRRLAAPQSMPPLFWHRLEIAADVTSLGGLRTTPSPQVFRALPEPERNDCASAAATGSPTPGPTTRDSA